MLQTIADDLWGRPSLAYHVQPDLHPDTQAALESLQGAITERWPVPLHLCPRDRLHVTIYALVPVKGAFDKESYWHRISEPSRALLTRLCSGHDPFKLRFSRIKVTDSAIIAVAEDETGLIDAIRRQIAEVIPPPPGQRPLRYNLIHSTLARYRSSQPVSKAIVEAIETLPVSIVAPVERIKIVRETLFPCLVMDEIVSFPLR